VKKVLCLLAAAVAMTTLQALAGAEDKREEKPRMKGVELYSWKDKDDNWLYVLVSGTNRIKTEKEIKESSEKRKGDAELLKALALLAVGEDVTWSHQFVSGFEFPSEKTREQIKKSAKEAKINLLIETK
jgi:hypothetical protein